MRRFNHLVFSLLIFAVVSLSSGCGSGNSCKPCTDDYYILLIRQNNTTAKFSTIQAAVDAANYQDTIRLGDGVYSGEGNYNVEFRGKAITICSESGNPEKCIIDCQRLGRAFSFDGSAGSNSTLQGVTITNGRKWPEYEPSLGVGGAVSCWRSSPTIRDCIFDDNRAKDTGGAIDCSWGAAPSISNCMFINNYVYSAGGAISCRWGSGASIEGCIFTGNTAPAGGALYTSCRGNDTSTDAVNCLFSKNRAKIGGVVFCESRSPRFTSCTFVSNSCMDADGGSVAYCAFTSNPRFAHSILVYNSEGTIFARDREISGPLLSCSDVFGNELGDWIEIISDQQNTNGNISADPGFADLTAGDLSLPDNSPCSANSSQCGQIGTLLQSLKIVW